MKNVTQQRVHADNWRVGKIFRCSQRVGGDIVTVMGRTSEAAVYHVRAMNWEEFTAEAGNLHKI